MLNKDKVLLEEAYISASNRMQKTPADYIKGIQPDSHINDEEQVTTNQPDTEAPLVLSIASDTEEESFEEHEDEEVRMAKTSLFTINEDSKAIFNALESGECIEPWMLQKIAVSSEMLSNVAKVVRYYTARTQAGLE